MEIHQTVYYSLNNCISHYYDYLPHIMFWYTKTNIFLQKQLSPLNVKTYFFLNNTFAIENNYILVCSELNT